MVGRNPELAILDAALDDAERGLPTTILVVGEAGVGKSRLLAEFTAAARSRGALVASGGCIELRCGGIPYGPFRELLRSVLGQAGPGELATTAGRPWEILARVLLGRRDPVEGVPGAAPAAGTSPEDGGLDQAALFEAVIDLVGRLGADAPLVVALEDLHWADPSSLDLLAYLAHGMRTERAVVVGTYRVEAVPRGQPIQAVATAVRRSERGEILELEGLSREQTGEQLAAILGTFPHADLLAAIHDRSDGNPLFTEELAAATRRGEGDALPDTLRELMLGRLAGRSDGAREVLSLVAVAGRWVSDGLLKAVAGLSDPALQAALHEAVDHALLVPSAGPAGEGYALRHAIIGETILEDLLRPERRALHARLAAAIAADPRRAADARASAFPELAHHWDAAGQAPEAFAAWLEAADAADEAHGYAAAQRHLVRALELWDRVLPEDRPSGLDRPALAHRAAHTAALAGASAAAVDLERTALEALGEPVDEARRAAYLQRLASYLSADGRDDAAIAAAHAALDAAPAGPPTELRARILATLGALAMLVGRFREARTYCDEAITVARALGLPEIECGARDFLGVSLTALGDLDGGPASLREAICLGIATGSVDATLDARNNLGIALLRADRPGEARTVLEEGIRAAREAGLDRRSGLALRASLASVLVRAGAWAEARQVLAEAAALAPEGEQAGALELLAGTLDIAAGRFADAQERLRAAADLCGRGRRVDVLPLLAVAEAELALWEGRLDVARRAVATGLASLVGSDESQMLTPLLSLGLRAEADRAASGRARRLGIDVEDAARAAAPLLATARELQDGHPASGLPVTPGMAADLAMVRAEEARLAGHDDPAAWADAGAAWDRAGAPYPAAYARWREAEALLADRARRRDGERRVEEVHRSALELGAEPLRREVEALALRARVELGGAPATAGTGVSGADPDAFGLTAREREVLALLQLGRTNREIARTLFISEKTAGVHVSNILGKMGVASRVEAAAVAGRAGYRSGTAGVTPAEPDAGSEGQATLDLMMTDMAGSTALMEAIGDAAWADLVRWHDRTIRALAARHAAREADRSGDGFFLVFSGPAAAADCAVGLQRALAEQRRIHGFAPGVRIGLHHAAVIDVGGAYAGMGVHLVARVAASASGGEIVATREFAQALGARYPTSQPRTVAARGISAPVPVVTIGWRDGAS